MGVSLVGVCKSLDGRFKYLLSFLGKDGILINNKQKINVDSLVILGVDRDGYVSGSMLFLSDFLALNQIKVIYTLEKNSVLSHLSKRYIFKIVCLKDKFYQNKIMIHQYNIARYLCSIFGYDIERFAVYGNDLFAHKSGLKSIKNIGDYQMVLNFNPEFKVSELVSGQVVFDFTDCKHGFLNLELKDYGVTFFAINQYLGQIMTKSGARLIYDSLVRNRVNY